MSWSNDPLAFNGRELFASTSLSRQYPDIVPSITGPIAHDIASMVLNCLNIIGDSAKSSPNVRRGLCDAVKKFHQDAGIDLDLSKHLSSLTKPDTIILRVAHQPNIFPYMGVVSQLVIMRILATKIYEITKRPVCEIFLFVDYDSSRDSRFRTAQLGDVRRRDGRLLINFPVSPSNLDLPMKYLAKPSQDQLEKWFELILDWGRSNLRFLHISNVDVADAHKEFEENAFELKNVLDSMLTRSSSFADFNAFFLSKITSDYWRYPVLFARLSDFQKTLAEAYNDLVSQYAKVNKLINEAKQFYISHGRVSEKGIDKGYYAKAIPSQLLPLWYSCASCHSRVALRIVRDEPLEIVGECPRKTCRKSYIFQIGTIKRPDLSAISENIFPRVEFQNLCLLPSLGVTAAIGYAGAADHMLVTYYVARKLGLYMPVLCLTQPSFVYAGLEQYHIYMRPPGKVEDVCRLICSSRLCSLDMFLNFGIEKSERMLYNAISDSKNLSSPCTCSGSHFSQVESSIVKFLQMNAKNRIFVGKEE